VSLALRHHHSIPPTTRQKVEVAAEKLGYAFDPDLSALMSRYRSKRTSRYQETLAWINTWPDPQALFFYYGGTWRGAQQRAHELGYNLESFNYRSGTMTPRRLSTILKTRNIRGVILPPQPRARAHIHLDWENYAVVTVGYSIAPARFHLITTEQFRSSYVAMRHLRQMGYRRIGYADYEGTSERTDQNYLGGFLVQQLRFKATERIAPFIFKAPEFKTFTFAPLVEARVKKQLAQWIERTRPEVILYHFPLIGQWVRDLGYKIPTQIGLAHFNVYPSDPNNSGIMQNDTQVGAMAVQILSGLLQRGEFGIPAVPIRHLVSGRWHDGDTLKRSHSTGK